MTKEQRSILQEQVDKIKRAQREQMVERFRLQQMLVLFDPRFADPDTGVSFDPETLEIVEPPPASSDESTGNSNAEE